MAISTLLNTRRKINTGDTANLIQIGTKHTKAPIVETPSIRIDHSLTIKSKWTAW
jgi:hypothetical protein